jgi:hypothetical protein
MSWKLDAVGAAEDPQLPGMGSGRIPRMTKTRGTVLHSTLCWLALALAACGADTAVSSPATANDNLPKLFERLERRGRSRSPHLARRADRDWEGGSKSSAGEATTAERARCQGERRPQPSTRTPGLAVPLCYARKSRNTHKTKNPSDSTISAEVIETLQLPSPVVSAARANGPLIGVAPVWVEKRSFSNSRTKERQRRCNCCPAQLTQNHISARNTPAAASTRSSCTLSAIDTLVAMARSPV